MSHDPHDSPNANMLPAHEARGVLAFLFRAVIHDRNIKMLEWNRKMNNFLDDPRNSIPRNGKDRSSARGNLNKELHRTRMTWKVFEKALRFLGPIRVRFEVHLTWANRETSVHHVEIPMGYREELAAENDETAIKLDAHKEVDEDDNDGVYRGRPKTALDDTSEDVATAIELARQHLLKKKK